MRESAENDVQALYDEFRTRTLRCCGASRTQRTTELSEADDPTAGSGTEGGERTVLPPDTLLIRKDMNDCISGIAEDLSEVHRTALVLSDLEGPTNAEITSVLGISRRRQDAAAPRPRSAQAGARPEGCLLPRRPERAGL